MILLLVSPISKSQKYFHQDNGLSQKPGTQMPISRVRVSPLGCCKWVTTMPTCELPSAPGTSLSVCPSMVFLTSTRVCPDMKKGKPCLEAAVILPVYCDHPNPSYRPLSRVRQYLNITFTAPHSSQNIFYI